MANEENSLTGRLTRYAKVGVAMSGVATRVVGKRVFGVQLDDKAHARELREALGTLKGPLMKVAQLLSTIPDAVPQEYIKELGQLQSNAPSMGWPFVKRRMAAELGPNWQSKFASFEREATAAASLGQVHRASAQDGTKLACKLQYPDMQSAVEADLRQLKVILGLFERYDSAISTSEVQKEIADRLREELNYALEASHMALYGDMLKNVPHVHVPRLVPELSTGRLLTMSWLEGQKILAFVDEHEDLRNQLATTMFKAWYTPFYHYGVIHGDPHLGNYTVRPNGEVNLLDYGCIRTFKPKFIGGVLDLYKALQSDDIELAVHAYESWGFFGLKKETIEVLNIWAKFLYAPVLEDRIRPLEETHSGQYGQATAAQVHRKLREVGGVTVPREFVFMDRAAIGLGSVFLHLNAQVNWYRLFHELTEGLDLAKVEKRQHAAFEKAGVPLP